MIIYIILYISFLVVPIGIVCICKHIYPHIFRSYKEIFSKIYILLLAILILFLLIKIFGILPNIDMNTWIGNFYLHSIWWGVACSILFLYIMKCTNIYIHWFIRFLIFIGFLCTLWVCNELAEFGLEYFRLGSIKFMSPTPLDTRLDLFANTIWWITWFIFTQVFLRSDNK